MLALVPIFWRRPSRALSVSNPSLFRLVATAAAASVLDKLARPVVLLGGCSLGRQWLTICQWRPLCNYGNATDKPGACLLPRQY